MSKYICFNDNGKTFVGDAPDRVLQNTIIENVRQIREMQIPTQQGIAHSIQILSCGVAREGVSMHVNLDNTIHWFPDKDEEAILEKLIEGCMRNEQQQRAKDSGLTLATSMPPR